MAGKNDAVLTMINLGTLHQNYLMPKSCFHDKCFLWLSSDYRNHGCDILGINEVTEGTEEYLSAYEHLSILGLLSNRVVSIRSK